MKKRYSLVLLALCAIIASLIIISCPSDVDEVRKVDAPEIRLPGGKLSVILDWDDPTNPIAEDETKIIYRGAAKITQGKTYTVKLNITDCDGDLPGSRLGGKLLYKTDVDDTEEKGSQLSGWAWAAPQVVLDGPGVYTWTFVAGEKNIDDLDCVSPATTPAGKTQIFSMQAQDEGFKEYPSYISFGIKGTVSFKEKIDHAPGSAEKVMDVTRVYTDSSYNSATGKGSIEGAVFTAIMNAKEDAYIHCWVTDVTITNTKVITEGWGVGNIGNKPSSGDTNPNPAISIPRDLNGGKAGSNLTFEAKVDVDAIKQCIDGKTNIFVNIYDNSDVGTAKVLRMELWDYTDY